MITVFTPTYNRRSELHNLYTSLIQQNYDDFEWLIIDDGSTDRTRQYIENIRFDRLVKIKYRHKENGGKQSAYNRGLQEASGDIFLCIDSDDILRENILKKIAKDFKKIAKNDKIAGIAYTQGYINNKKEIIGTPFPIDDLEANYFDIYHKYNVTGDKLIVLKTKIAKKYRFPMIKGEKFVPEALIFNRISKDYNFICKNSIAAYKEYLDNGYSNNYFNLVKKNPKGNRLYFKELYELDKKIYNIYGYLLFSIYAKIKFREIIKEHPAKIKIIFMYLPVWIISKIRK